MLHEILSFWRAICPKFRAVSQFKQQCGEFQIVFNQNTISNPISFAKATKISLKIDCAWAKSLSKTKRIPGEGNAKFAARLLQDRFKIFNEHFQEYPGLHIKREDFMRHYRTIDEKFHNWRSKTEKEAYLTGFSSMNWNEGKVISKEGKEDHSLTSCQACLLFNS